MTKEFKELEKKHRKKLEEFINSIEDEDRRKRMQQLQWRIDGQLMKYKDPVARMNKTIELMWDGFLELNRVLQCENKNLKDISKNT